MKVLFVFVSFLILAACGDKSVPSSAPNSGNPPSNAPGSAAPPADK